MAEEARVIEEAREAERQAAKLERFKIEEAERKAEEARIAEEARKAQEIVEAKARAAKVSEQTIKTEPDHIKTEKVSEIKIETKSEYVKEVIEEIKEEPKVEPKPEPVAERDPKYDDPKVRQTFVKEALKMWNIVNTEQAAMSKEAYQNSIANNTCFEKEFGNVFRVWLDKEFHITPEQEQADADYKARGRAHWDKVMERVNKYIEEEDNQKK